MSGFDLGDLLPFYLDESDEQIVGLGALLLQLEQAPDDEKALREAFRLIHSLKGGSTVMGFDEVKGLTHHLETYFDELRAGRRRLDRPSLDIVLRCLDALRDYHAELREKGSSEISLAELTELVVTSLGKDRRSSSEPRAEAPAGSPTPTPEPLPDPGPGPEPEVDPEPVAGAPVVEEPPPPIDPPSPVEEPPPPMPTPAVSLEQPGTLTLVLVFEPGLSWPDMKAKLVLTRLSAKARVIATRPRVEDLDDIEALPEFAIDLEADCDIDELHALADVDGVAEIRVEGRSRPRAIPAHAPAPQRVEERVQAPAPPPERPEAGAPPPSPIERPADEPASKPTPEPQGAEKRAKVTETVRVDVDRLDQLMNLAGELVISKARFFEFSRGLEELFRGSNAQVLASDTSDRLESIARGLEGLLAHGGGEDGSAERWASQFRRLRENFRAIQDELDIIRQGRERLNTMAEAIDHLARVSDGIQRGVLETRMVPIGPLFDRFQRVIRDLRLSSGKEVTLRIDGEKTELDKRMVDELGDPIVHLVRNSVDHGLEAPDERERLGKPRAGTVSMTASHRGNSIVITVGDDGRGIDAERVRRKAVANGLIGEEESRRLSEHQLIQFIWHPGLSTAEKITDISGRGVGMDIVKSRIESLNGSVDVRSEPGVGTTFSIRLPLTLAILPVLLTRIGGEAYAIPLDHLAEVIEVGRGDIYSVQGRPAIEIRGRIISLLTLGDAFGREGLASLEEAFAGGNGNGNGHAHGQAESKKPLTVAIISNGEETAGLVVDELIGMQEAVLKSLEKNFQPVPGLSGVSILGNGRVSLILDIEAVIRMAASNVAGAAARS